MAASDKSKLLSGKGGLGYDTFATTNKSSAQTSADASQSSIPSHKSSTADKAPSKVFLYLFYWNVFCSCVSFALVMPSLWPYLQSMNSTEDFMAWCVSVYSIGEFLGSLILGDMYNRFGAKPILLFAIFTGTLGSFLYGSAMLFSDEIGPWLVLIGRFCQGVWTGGEQSVETAYVGENIHKNYRTHVISVLSTYACMGFVLGPAIGTPLETVDFYIFGLHIDRNMIPGFFIMCTGVLMFSLTFFLFEGESKAHKLQHSSQLITIDDIDKRELMARLLAKRLAAETGDSEAANSQYYQSQSSTNKIIATDPTAIAAQARQSVENIDKNYAQTTDDTNNGRAISHRLSESSAPPSHSRISNRPHGRSADKLTSSHTGVPHTGVPRSQSFSRVRSPTGSVSGGHTTIADIIHISTPTQDRFHTKTVTNSLCQSSSEESIANLNMNTNLSGGVSSLSAPTTPPLSFPIVSPATAAGIGGGPPSGSSGPSLAGGSSPWHSVHASKLKPILKSHSFENREIVIQRKEVSNHTASAAATAAIDNNNDNIAVTIHRRSDDAYDPSSFKTKLRSRLSTNANVNANATTNTEDNGTSFDLIFPDRMGMFVCMLCFLVHFEGFAVQETITTALVEHQFSWSETDANLLFTGAAALSLLVFLGVTYLSKICTDYQLLMASLLVGFIGHCTLMKYPKIAYNPHTFLTGYAFITIAFPLGRACVLSMFSKILGPHPQGKFMGYMFTCGAVSRIVAPLFVVQLYLSMGPTLLFGTSAILFFASIILLITVHSRVRPHCQLELFEILDEMQEEVRVHRQRRNEQFVQSLEEKERRKKIMTSRSLYDLYVAPTPQPNTKSDDDNNNNNDDIVVGTAGDAIGALDRHKKLLKTPNRTTEIVTQNKAVRRAPFNPSDYLRHTVSSPLMTPTRKPVNQLPRQ